MKQVLRNIPNSPVDIFLAQTKNSDLSRFGGQALAQFGGILTKSTPRKCDEIVEYDINNRIIALDNLNPSRVCDDSVNDVDFMILGFQNVLR